MNLLFTLTSLLFFIWIFRNTLFWVALWQLKEYRFDRILIHLRDTHQGKSLMFSPLSIIKLVSVLAYPFLVLNNQYTSLFSLLVLTVYFIQFLLIIKEINTHVFKRPVITFKSLIIIFLTILTVVSIFLLPLVDKYIWIIFLDKLTILIIAFFVFLFSFPTEIYRDWKISQAIKKINSQKNLLVIGVTGSFGKSSTKDYIAQILSKKFNVLKTQGTNNTPIGIANTILSGLKQNTEILVVEMGAYKKGEISQMCQIVHPKIGVLTAVSNQHLSLFGNVQNIMEAKYELIQALPLDGLALFNGNNENAFKLFKKTKKNKILYYSKNKNNTMIKDIQKEKHIIADDIVVEKNQLLFNVSINKLKMSLRARLIGMHNIENILPGIYIASNLGMKEKEIERAVVSLTNLPKTMSKHMFLKNSVMIDDTFNANPDAVLAALKYMSIYKGKKIMVLQPMIELGNSAGLEHERIAKEISRVCDFLLLTNNNYFQNIKQGLSAGGGECVLKVGSPTEIANFVGENLSKESITVFEGKEAAFALKKVMNKSN